MPTLDNEPIVLVCAADDNYAMPLAVMVRSVLENLGNDRYLSVFIIDGGIAENNKLKILNSINSHKVNIKWLQLVDNLFDIEESTSYYTNTIYYRLFIPQFLPEYSKAIYLDSDLIVIEDIGKLWDLDVREQYVLAARDLYPSPIFSSGYETLTQLQNFKTKKMFNSGVLLMNLERWRNEKIGIKAIKCCLQYKLLDQEALNIILKDKWKELDPRWNRTNGIYEYESWVTSPFSEEKFNNLVNNPYIIHFTSAAKPWNSIGENPAQKLYYHYLDMTAWSGWRFTYWKRIKQKFNRESNKILRRFSVVC